MDVYRYISIDDRYRYIDDKYIYIDIDIYIIYNISCV